jgi:hypothetical protein
MWAYYDWVYCCCRPSVNTICGRIIIGLSLLSSVSKHNMWLYYDWVYCCCRSSVNIICSRIMIGLSVSSVSKHNYCVYWRTTTTINPIIIRPHYMFTDRRQQRQPNHNTTTYCAYGRTKATINAIIIRPNVVVLWLGLLLLSSVSKHNMWSYYDWVVVVVRQ